jgi:hypothetical protein
MEVWFHWPEDSLISFEVWLNWDAAVCTVEAVTVTPFPGWITASSVDNSVPSAGLGASRMFGDYIGSGDHLAATVDFRILDTAVPPCSSYVDTLRASTLRDQHANVYYPTYDGNYVAVPAQFLRCDANVDSVIEMSDAIFTLQALYVPGSDTLLCKDAADSDDNGSVEMSDAIFTLRHLYVPGAPDPDPPFPNCGADPTSDDLDCSEHPCME